jgi:hypothetical protein
VAEAVGFPGGLDPRPGEFDEAFEPVGAESLEHGPEAVRPGPPQPVGDTGEAYVDGVPFNFDVGEASRRAGVNRITPVIVECQSVAT